MATNKGVILKSIAWKQTWKNLLFQHFIIKNTDYFMSLLPKGYSLDFFDNHSWLGLVSMEMHNVRHPFLGDFVLWKKYHELNVRTYVIDEHGDRGVFFLSLDVDSLLSVIGARLLYGLPYRFRRFYDCDDDNVTCYKSGKVQFKANFSVVSKPKLYEKDTFAFWTTERYYFTTQKLGFTLKASISHKPWNLSKAKCTNHSLQLLNSYNLGEQHPDILFCKSIEITAYNPIWTRI